MTAFQFECRTCRQTHAGIPAFGAEAPDAYLALPEGERAARAELSSDQCVIDDKQFFIRACLELPVRAHAEPLSWGVWVSVSETSFQRVAELWEVEGREAEPPLFGWLNTSVPGYQETRNLNARVRLQPVGTRPIIELEPTPHLPPWISAKGSTRTRCGCSSSAHCMVDSTPLPTCARDVPGPLGRRRHHRRLRRTHFRTWPISTGPTPRRLHLARKRRQRRDELRHVRDGHSADARLRAASRRAALWCACSTLWPSKSVPWPGSWPIWPAIPGQTGKRRWAFGTRCPRVSPFRASSAVLLFAHASGHGRGQHRSGRDRGRHDRRVPGPAHHDARAPTGSHEWHRRAAGVVGTRRHRRVRRPQALKLAWEIWWRRRESNPGPEVIHVGLYVRSPCTCFAVGSAHGQARFTAIDSLFRPHAESNS